MKKLYTNLLALGMLTFATTTQLSAQNVGLDFDGNNDYVSTTVPSISGNTAKTIQAIIKTTAPAGSQKVIADMGSSVINGQRFTFNVLWGGALRLEIGGGGVNGTIPVNDGQYHHVAVTYDPTASTKFKLYVDGVLDASGNITAASVSTASGNLVIGRRVDAINNFLGIIDEVKVYNYARTLAQIQNDTASQSCGNETGLVAYFKFNEGTASGSNTAITTAVSSNGTSHTGTLQNFALTGTSSNYITSKVLATPSATSSTINATVCGTYTSPSGKQWTSSGTYLDTIPNAHGCDSLMTITLTSGSIKRDTTTVANCGPYTWPVNSQVYTSSGMYSDTFTASTGCDSIKYLSLTIAAASNDTTAVSACDSFTWAANNITYTTSGVYTKNFTNVGGCDSTVSIDLTINVVNNSVTVNGATLTAAAGADAYQWYNCTNNIALSGANSQSYTPTASGSYKVLVTKGTCSAYSECKTVSVVGINSIDLKHDWNIYPNPTKGQLNIEAKNGQSIEKVKIVDALGRVVLEQLINSNNAALELNQSAGVYYLIIESNGQQYATMITKS